MDIVSKINKIISLSMENKLRSKSKPDIFEMNERNINYYLDQLSNELEIENEKFISLRERLCQFFSARDSKYTTNNFNYILNAIVNAVLFIPISSVETVFTEKCNFSCDYCFMKIKRPISFSYELAKQALDFLNIYSGDTIEVYFSILGGEPLLEFKKIIKTVEYADTISQVNGKKINFDATTNGLLLNEDILSQSKGRIKYLLSIDGDKESHDKHRKLKNGSGSFEQIISKIKSIKKYQPWLGARMTICPDTVKNLSHNVEFLFNNGINQFLLGMVYGLKWEKRSLKIYEEELTKVSEYYSSKIQAKEPIRITFFENPSFSLNNYKNRWGCRAGRNSVSIIQNGDIYPCNMFIGLESNNCKEFFLGNISEGITKLSAREKIYSLYNNNFEDCLQCRENNSCPGGCIAENYNQNRSIYKPSKDQCEITKIQNRVLRNYQKQENGKQ